MCHDSYAVHLIPSVFLCFNICVCKAGIESFSLAAARVRSFQGGPFVSSTNETQEIPFIIGLN